MRPNFARQLLSIQERKISALIVTLFGLTGLGGYLALTSEARDLPGNLVSVLVALITAIAGVNAVEYLANGKVKSGDQDND
jgi:hypothetical protein